MVSESEGELLSDSSKNLGFGHLSSLLKVYGYDVTSAK